MPSTAIVVMDIRSIFILRQMQAVGPCTPKVGVQYIDVLLNRTYGVGISLIKHAGRVSEAPLSVVKQENSNKNKTNAQTLVKKPETNHKTIEYKKERCERKLYCDVKCAAHA
jgi:hypothetical protein